MIVNFDRDRYSEGKLYPYRAATATGLPATCGTACERINLRATEHNGPRHCLGRYERGRDGGGNVI